MTDQLDQILISLLLRPKASQSRRIGASSAPSHTSHLRIPNLNHIALSLSLKSGFFLGAAVLARSLDRSPTQARLSFPSLPFSPSHPPCSPSSEQVGLWEARSERGIFLACLLSSLKQVEKIASYFSALFRDVELFANGNEESTDLTVWCHMHLMEGDLKG